MIQNRARVVHASGDRPGVRVEEQLGRIEASAGGGVPRSVDAETVPLLRANPSNEDGPNAVVIPAHVVVGLLVVFVDESQLDPCRTRGPKPESSSTVAHVCTKD